MHFLLTPVGSAGDNFPFIGLGARLAERGHRVTVVTNDHFEPMVRACRLEFAKVGTEAEYRQVIADPDIWHERKGFRTVMMLVAELNRRLFDAVAALYARSPGDTAVVAHTFDFASRAIAEKHGLPVVAVHLQPTIMRTLHEAPVMMGAIGMARWPRWLKRAFWWLVDFAIIDRYVTPTANAPRRRLGLPPVKHAFAGYIHSPLLTLGMWPDWFGAAQPDYPKSFRQAGFPLFDAPGTADLTPEVDAYLSAGEPPIVFTPGSANVHAGPFFDAAIGAARALGRRTLLLTGHPEQLPALLPSNVAHFRFAPLSRILPRCAALVHHGGIGTTAAGLAGGVPQLVMPLSHDQPDNAARIVRLGAGARLMPKKFTTANVTEALRRLLDSPEIKARCAEYARRCAQQDALGEACTLIESAIANRNRPAGSLQRL